MPNLLENSLSHLLTLVEFWNLCSVDPFWMDVALMRQYLERSGAKVWVESAPWEGVLWARLGETSVTLDALWVRPDRRRQGVGGRLLQSFVSALPPGQQWRFGGGEHHFVPGLPDQLAEYHPFFLKHGLAADWEAHDLLWTSEAGGATEWDRKTYRLLGPSDLEALFELLDEFGVRWRKDTRRRGDSLVAGAKEEIMGAFHQGRLVGFCHIWSRDSASLGPSTFWLDRGGEERWGGIGPLGVHPGARGHGYGAGVVEASMAYLRHKGAESIGVDWTGLPDFYEGRGFRRWLSYRGYHPEATERPS